MGRGYDSYQFEENLSVVYEKIVCWKKNLFLLPSGCVGTQFIGETTKLMNKWIHDSPLTDISFKAIMIMPSLLLQKTSQKSKSREYSKALERRKGLWASGEILDLLNEGETIQKNLGTSNTLLTVAKISKKFTLEMHKENVTIAMKLLTDNIQNGILPLNKKNLEPLTAKTSTG